MIKDINFLDAWIIEPSDKTEMKADFDLWVENHRIYELEYYNGELFFFVNIDEIVCKKCMKADLRMVDEITTIASNLESIICCDLCGAEIEAQYPQEDE